ncbi:MAG TPA: GTP 3',8-cyclase MoaA [Polyangiaceae bacterium]|jgi:cyclic pyranopterin phosphate synthase|nr:GTP 3',8-cyclase MoaA [Polyangiaceae bacterium]
MATQLEPRYLPVVDRRKRPLTDLRVSVTDRCNFRCTYCMPRQVFDSKFKFLPREEILSFEEIVRLATVFAALGVRKVRLTGGEPLLRQGLPELIQMLAAIPDLEIVLTTNGSLLAEKAEALMRAGLHRLTVSLDALDNAVFSQMNDVDFPVERVLHGISAARAAGLPPANINAVIRRGVNESAVLDLARHFKGTGHRVRFIEFMDVGLTNGWRLDQVVPASEIVAQINEHFPLEAIGRLQHNDVATRFRYQDGSGEIGIVASVTQPFCGDCTRGRLSTDGKFFTCLFACEGLDLRTQLRSGVDDDHLLRAIADYWGNREDRYSEQRSANTRNRPRMEMSYLGG